MASTEVIIPAYNEQHRIEPTLRSYLKFFADQPVRFTVVLNGCEDRTAEVVQQVQRSWPSKLTMKEVRGAIGKGGAILQGWRESTAELVGFVDADGATQPAEFAKLFRSIDGVDGVIASRFVSDASTRRTGIRSLLSLGFRAIVHLFFRLPFRDTQCGAKLFRRSALAEVLPRVRVTNMAFDVDLLVECQKKSLRIKEIGTAWNEQANSQMFRSVAQQMSVGFKMFLSLIYIRFFKSRS